jgi:hypothetical protein
MPKKLLEALRHPGPLTPQLKGLNYRSTVDRMMPGGGLEPPTRGFSARIWQI